MQEEANDDFVNRGVFEAYGSFIEVQLGRKDSAEESYADLRKAYFIHESDFEFLKTAASPHDSDGSILQDWVLATMCLRYLQFNWTWTEAKTTDAPASCYPEFRSYARYWPMHVLEPQRIDKELSSLIENFLDNKNASFVPWVNSLYPN